MSQANLYVVADTPRKVNPWFQLPHRHGKAKDFDKALQIKESVGYGARIYSPEAWERLKEDLKQQKAEQVQRNKKVKQSAIIKKRVKNIAEKKALIRELQKEVEKLEEILQEDLDLLGYSL